MPRMKIEVTGKSYTVKISQLGSAERVKKVGKALRGMPTFVEEYTGMKEVRAIIHADTQSKACTMVRNILKAAGV